MTIILYRLLAVILIWIPFNVSAQADKSLPFKAGASKIDLTPAEKDIPAARFKYGIRDNLYIRAVVVDNGVASAALCLCGCQHRS